MLYKLLKYDPTLRKIFTLTSSDLRKFFLTPMKKAVLLYKDIHNPDWQTQINQDLAYANIITLFDKNYPDSLRNIPDAPLVLYILGDERLFHHPLNISVIGTRNPSKEATPKVNMIISPLIEQGWVIVSGLAYGVDRQAHERTLALNGKTIAVLGGGFQHVYPKQHFSLYEQIVKKGLVISEYPPFTPPKRYHFPERNRIISGLTRATLVIEATERSGTLITVDQALEQGKEVYAVPGSPLLPQTKGCHRMIQDGAKLTTCAEDILEDVTIFSYK
jgi:DNA processing protein